MAHDTNIFETHRRSEKAKKLISAIDSFFISVRISMPEIQLDTLQRTGAVGRAQVASLAGVPMPSDATWELVLDEYRARVQRAVDFEIAKALAGALKSAGSR
jgi:hypothetical protein